MTRGLPSRRVRQRFWRVLSPRWASEPTSGEGAARHGGRFNARGRPALYMSEDFATAVAEYEQELGIRPGFFCAYEVWGAGIVDLTDDQVRRHLGIELRQLRIPWKHVALIERKRPATWELSERLIAAGAMGIRVASTRTAGTNLVLWRWNERGCPAVRVIDPLGDLPRAPRRR